MTQSALAVDKNKQKSTIEFQDESLADGGEGKIYLSEDNQSVVKLFHSNVNKRMDVLEEILAAGPSSSEAVSQYLAWPTHVVVDTTGRRPLGVVMPNVQRQIWMKPMAWYRSTKVWRELPEDERGTFKGRVQAAFGIAAAGRYLNRIGYAHADLSRNNVFVNPVEGKSTLIDLDGLVVPKYIEGVVLGTPGYMAPELVTGIKARPDKFSDRHALAVVLYEFLLMGHPLQGGRPPLANDAEEDDLLTFGREALYRENPIDKSNRPRKTFINSALLGRDMNTLFQRAFVEGLFHPELRPAPDEFEAGLKRLLEDLITCSNPNCYWKYYPSLEGDATNCPLCGTAGPAVARGWARVLKARQPGFYPFNQPDTKHRLKKDGILKRQQIFGSNIAEPDKTCLTIILKQGNTWGITLHDKTASLSGEVLRKKSGKGQLLQPGHEITTDEQVQIFISDGTRDSLVEFNRTDSW